MSLPRATLINDDPAKKCARVTPGLFDAALIRDMFEAYEEHVDLASNVTVAKLVARAIKGIKDPTVVRWFRADKERILKLPVDALKNELRLLLLDPDWESQVLRDIRHLKQADADGFQLFFYAVCEKNRLLEDTNSYLEDDALKAHLLACMHDALRTLYDKETARLSAIDDLTEWVKAVETIDKKRRKDDKVCNDAIAVAIAKARYASSGLPKRPCDDDHAQSGPKKAARTDENKNPNAASSSSFAPAGGKAKRLKDAEKALIDANFGCRKCRQLFVWHCGTDNVCEFPPSDVKTVTKDTVAAAKAALIDEQKARLAATISKGKGKPPVAAAVPARSGKVAAVFADYQNDDEPFSSDSESDLDSSGVRTHRDAEPTADAASSDPEDEVPRSHSPQADHAHLFFDCLIEGERTNLPYATRGLIDNGSFLVLIDEDLVEHVGLKKRKLHKPIPFDTALSNDDSNTSSSSPCATEPRSKLREAMKEVMQQRRLLAAELRGVCEKRRDKLEADGLFEYGKPVDAVAAV
ncbi:hypothetical protein C8F01DRAFT_1275439 [Mycena amicta]|nr:hypothetical protein C8F01DRAFT_1275439 [Mycena amicta]